ncbi:MAG: prepilin-type N-terminal cleavage/methylation domain-containing protein [Fimbriimonadales bacterium]
MRTRGFTLIELLVVIGLSPSWQASYSLSLRRRASRRVR